MSLLAFLVTAAEEAEKSETPFYVAGGLLAVIAVVAGAIGITRPSLEDGPAKVLMAAVVVFALATMAATIAVS